MRGEVRKVVCRRDFCQGKGEKRNTDLPDYYGRALETDCRLGGRRILLEHCKRSTATSAIWLVCVRNDCDS